MSSQNIQLYLTKPHDCSYIDDKQSINLVPDPEIDMDMTIYSQLIQLGYRRSGSHTYKPHCNDCEQCIPCRVPVKQFKAKKSQRRCLKINQDLSMTITPAYYSEEHFKLYSQYLLARHHDGGMVNPTPEDFNNFLFCEWSDTDFIEFRQDNVLKAVAVTDKVTNGLSAVYSFYDTSEAKRGLGTFCVLQQIGQAISLELDYLYLGFWIQNNDKMRYKTNFNPIEIYKDQQWIKHEPK